MLKKDENVLPKSFLSLQLAIKHPLSSLFPMSDTLIVERTPDLPFGLRADRVAVSLLFLANGFLIGSWAPKIPLLMARLGITETTMGLLILVFGLGSILMMPVIGALTARYGSAPVLRIVSVIVLPLLLAVSILPELWMIVVAIFLFGGFVGGMDVAMNANAVAVEKRMRKAIMSSCHGFWSLGGLIGAGLGGFMASLWGEIGHGVALTILASTAVFLALPMIARDHTTAAIRAAQPLRMPRSPLPYLIGIMALFSMVPEGTILDWAAHYLQSEMSADISIASLGFAAFSGTMAIMRFLGDGIRQRLGAVTTLRISAAFAITGLFVGALAPTPFAAIAGFAFAGIGIANMIPIAFSAAGNIPGVAPGIGLSVVTVMGYSGILMAPGVIGFIGERTGFSPVFMGVASLILVTLALSGLARHADFKPD
ncbi:MFS transporter [Pelagibacterium lentulum]|uniref:MFS transporter n=2 Tax=Pelagibacterium lentulum TaxID=2029865 RepID=A0A916VYS1_9HYPH|nr:MFS transporter [Pelagibacterium lentulum]